MRLLDERPGRLATIPYQAAGPGGATQNVRLAVERLRVDALPGGCAAVLAAGDLQGVAPSPLGGEPVLLGIALADYLGVRAESGLLPPADRIGVLLTGDLYAATSADPRIARAAGFRTDALRARSPGGAGGEAQRRAHRQCGRSGGDLRGESGGLSIGACRC